MASAVERVALRVQRAFGDGDDLELAEGAGIGEVALLEEAPIVGDHRLGLIGLRRQAVEDHEQRHAPLPSPREDVPRDLVGVTGGGAHEDDEVGELEQLDRERAIGDLDAVEVGRVDQHQAAGRIRQRPQLERSRAR